MRAKTEWQIKLGGYVDFLEAAEMIRRSEFLAEDKYSYIPNPSTSFSWSIEGTEVHGALTVEGERESVVDLMSFYELQGWKIEEDA